MSVVKCPKDRQNEQMGCVGCSVYHFTTLYVMSSIILNLVTFSLCVVKMYFMCCVAVNFFQRCLTVQNRAGVHIFCENLVDTSNLWVLEGRHEASSILMTHCAKFSHYGDLAPGIFASLN
jgi:hypothetical protein